MKVSLLFLWLCSFSIYLSDNHTCEKKLSNNCDFPESIAHGIHSLTLQDLRYYFDEKAQKNNTIPSINWDLSSDDLLFDSAPILQLNNSFRTPAMNSVDHILSNWETKDFMMKHGGVLEKLVHNLHVYETLSMSGKVYKQIVKKLKKEKKKKKGRREFEGKMKRICSCIEEKYSDIESHLTKMANSTREADEHQGEGEGEHDHDGEHEHEEHGEEGCKGWKNMCRLNFNNKSCKNRHLIVDPDHVHTDGSSDYVQPLVNSTSWKDWKDHLKGPDEQQWNFNLAVYIYCKLD